MTICITGVWIVCNEVLNSSSDQRRGVPCPALSAVQGVPGERADREAHSGTTDSAVLVREYALGSGAAERRAGVLQGARHAAGIS